ncbi:MAG: cupin domain-containing protein [Chloroflexota bacterium]
MEILDASNLMSRAENVGDGAHMAQLYPSGEVGNALLALDLLEVDAGGSTSLLHNNEEHVLFVVSGDGELRGGNGGPAAVLRPDTIVFVGPGEVHSLANTGSVQLRVLVSTPLLVRSERALGRAGQAVASTPGNTRAATDRQEVREPVVVRERPGSPNVQAARPDPRVVQSEPADDDAAPLPDISALMKRGSDIAAAPRSERRRPEPAQEPVAVPEPEPPVAEDADEEDEDEHRDLMELSVVFDGGSRGNPGQGYGSYLVQSPGRKPVIKRVEFGDNYTNNQAEYESLIACLQYIIERLTITNRLPAQVALDIKSDSDLLVNQLQGNYKVKDAGIRQRHTQAMELLEQFGEWMITWHAREESVRLLGH